MLTLSADERDRFWDTIEKLRQSGRRCALSGISISVSAVHGQPVNIRRPGEVLHQDEGGTGP